MEPKIMGTLTTPDGYWRVEAVRYGRTETWFRIWHATTMLADRASLATVERILGDQYPTLIPVADLEGPAAVSR